MSEQGEMVAQESDKVYLLCWQREYCYLRLDWTGGERVPGRRFVKLFRSWEAAEAYLEGLRQGRIPPPPEANPFLSFCEGYDGDDLGLENLTSMPDPIFADLVRDLGLTPPGQVTIKPRRGEEFLAGDWGNWWQVNAPNMTDAQRTRIWQALDVLAFYKIVELDLAD